MVIQDVISYGESSHEISKEKEVYQMIQSFAIRFMSENL